jgi:hypothetical protein
MKLTDLVSKPALTKLTLDDEETVKQYGEPLDFYTMLPMPLDVFMQFQLSTDGKDNLVNVLKDVILDEEGKKVLRDGKTMPPTLLMQVVNKIVAELGKSQGRN